MGDTASSNSFRRLIIEAGLLKLDVLDLWVSSSLEKADQTKQKVLSGRAIEVDLSQAAPSQGEPTEDESSVSYSMIVVSISKYRLCLSTSLLEYFVYVDIYHLQPSYLARMLSCLFLAVS